MVKLSSIKNTNNYMSDKNGNCYLVQWILSNLYLGKKTKKKFFYNGEELEVDITKDDIEIVKYTDLGEWFEGYNIKGNEYKVYDDSYLSKLPKDFIERLDNANKHLVNL